MPPKSLPSFMNTQVKQKTPLKTDSQLKVRSVSPGPANSLLIAAATSPSKSQSDGSGNSTQKSSSLCRRNLCCLTIVVSLIFCFLFSPFELWYTDSLSPQLTLDINPAKFMLAQSPSSIDEVAFVFTAFGSKTNEMRCSAAIETLVRHAGWVGDVYLIHDGQENCFNVDQLLQDSGLQREKLHLVKYQHKLKTSLRSGEDNVLSASLVFSSALAEWDVKSRLFDFITDPKFKVLISVDCDSLFALEGCAASLIAKALDWTPTDAKIKFTSVDAGIDENNKTNIFDIGTLVVHREFSIDALRKWNEHISLGEFSLLTAIEKTQKALKPGEVNPLSVGLITMTSSSLPVTSSQEDSFERNDIFHKAACINHISATSCNILGKDNVQRIVNKFDLKSYRGISGIRYKYCHHPITQLLLDTSSWIPWKRFPYCLKFDRYFDIV